MTVFKLQANSSGPRPFVLYPSEGKTVWVIGTKFGPFLSQIINFTVGAAPRVVLNTTSSLGSIVVDRHGKVWFAGGSGVGYYDPVTKTAQNVTSLQEYSWFIATDATDRLWVTLDSNKIAMYDPSSGQNTIYPVSTPRAVLQGITVAPDGMIWFAEAGAGKLGRLDPNTATITEYSSPLKLVAPIQVAVDKSNIVWFTDHGTNEFGSFNPNTKEWRKYPIGYCPGASCSVGLPNAIFVDQNGKVWFSEHLAGRIAKYDPESGIIAEYIIPTPIGSAKSEFAFSWWTSPGPNNLVWFTAFGYGEVGYVNASVPVPISISTNADLTLPWGSSRTIPVTVRSERQGMISVGVLSSSLDSVNGDSVLSGSYIRNLQIGAGPSKLAIEIRAGFGIGPGQHYVTVTVSDGEVAMSIPVLVTIVDNLSPYLTLAADLSIIVGGAVLYFRRPRKPTVSELSVKA